MAQLAIPYRNTHGHQIKTGHSTGGEEMNRIIRNGNLETQYSAEDFVNPESFDSHDTKQKAFVILDAGYVQAIVFGAYCEQDALDEAVDSGKLDGLQCDETELADYQTGTDSEGYPEYSGITYLGNASEPFADESLDIWILPASHFAEDEALMRPERVLVHLEDMQDKTERAYKATDVNASEWFARYQDARDAEYAITLYRFAQTR